jgi:hypothetical protein
VEVQPVSVLRYGISPSTSRPSYATRTPGFSPSFYPRLPRLVYKSKGYLIR